MNFVNKAQRILSFGQAGRDHYTYEYHLQELMAGYRLTHKDFAELAEMGEKGVILLNRIVSEYRKRIQYA